jgi:hypothetical protein
LFGGDGAERLLERDDTDVNTDDVVDADDSGRPGNLSAASTLSSGANSPRGDGLDDCMRGDAVDMDASPSFASSFSSARTLMRPANESDERFSFEKGSQSSAEENHRLERAWSTCGQVRQMHNAYSCVSLPRQTQSLRHARQVADEQTPKVAQQKHDHRRRKRVDGCLRQSPRFRRIFVESARERERQSDSKERKKLSAPDTKARADRPKSASERVSG